MVLMECTTSLLSHDSQSLIANTHTHIIDVIDVLHILITLEYVWIIIVHTVIKNRNELTSFSITSNE
jgi:hypothetical protein